MEFEHTSEYISLQEQETKDKSRDQLVLSPWTVQTIVFEILQNHMLTNDPKASGYTFEQKYSTVEAQSGISLAISYNWKADIASKRPAVFVARGDASIRYPTFRHGIGGNPAESETKNLALVSMPVRVLVVASPVGFAEQLADYVRQPLMYYAQSIQCDFGFERFRLVEISKPQIYTEATDNFVVELSLQVDYSDGWTIRGDHLKLKTFSAQIFDSVTKKPMENQ